MRISRKFLALGAFFVVAAAVAGCGSSVPGDSVASVGGNPITIQAYDHWMYVEAKVQAQQAAQQGGSVPAVAPNDPPNFSSCIAQIHRLIPALKKQPTMTLRNDCKQVFAQYNPAVMNYLIDSYWYQAQAAKQGITVSDASVMKTINKAIKSQFQTKARFLSYLATVGQTQEDVHYQIRVQKLFTALVNHDTKKVSNADISRYYDAHKSVYATPATATVHLIRTNTSGKATAAYNALKSGQSWDSVAKQYAADAASRTNGGLLTGLTAGAEENAVNKVIFASPINKLEGPVHGQFGWYVLENVKLKAGTQQTLAQATKAIKATLKSQNQTAAEKTVSDRAKANWQSKTHCRAAFQIPACGNYKAPSTTTTATPSTTTPSNSTGTTSGTSSTGATSSAKTTTKKTSKSKS